MNDDLTGHRVGTALRDHVPSTPQAPFDLADVKGRARGMRRRRTLAGAATGVLATVVAATMAGPPVVTALQDRDETRLPPAAQSPTPTPRGDVQLTGSEPRGDDAAGWYDAALLGSALGTPAPDDAWQMPQVARLGDAWVVSHRERGAVTVRLTAADGDVTTWKATEGSTAVAAGDGVVAFVDRTTDELTLLGADGDGWTERTLATVPQGAAVTGVEGEGCSTGGECRVLLTFGDGRGPLLVDGAGSVTAPEADGATAMHGDLLALLDEPGLDQAGEMEEAPCTRVVEGDQELWGSCDLRVVGFSPDGRWALVTDAYLSGWGLTRVGVADARTGELLFWIDPPGESAGVDSNGAVWEDSGHVVLSTWSWDASTWGLFRVSLTGEVERAAESRKGTEGDFPFFPPID